MCFTSGGRHRDDAKCWGVYRAIEPAPQPDKVTAVKDAADADAADVEARYASWREIERAVNEAARRAEAYERLERALEQPPQA